MFKGSGIRTTTSDSMVSPLNRPEVSTPPAIDTCSSLVDSHVSQLMDDLFQGLNEEMGEATLISVPQTSQTSARRLSVSSSSSLAKLLPRSQALEDSLLVPFVELGALLDPLPTNPSTPLPEQERSRQNLWLGVSCTAFVGSLGLWGLSLLLRPTPQPTVAQAVPQAAVPINPANVAFATELEDALHRAEQLPTVAAADPIGPVPTVAPSQIRPATASSQLPLQSVQGHKATLPAKSVAKLSPPALPQGTAKPPSAKHTVAMSALEGRLPQLTPNQSPQTSLSVSSPVTPVASKTLPVENQSKAGVTVQGILDLGDQSAMLISRNGSSQNVRLGEALDVTGWTFVRVEQGQAIIQRGNEVRSINTGEQF
jgi:hypothetical protein